MKFYRGIGLLLAAGMLFTACGAKEPEKEPSSASSVLEESVEVSSIAKETSEPAQESTVAFVDSVGREVTIPKNIERIVPSGGLAQQVLLTLAPEKVVALSANIKGEVTRKILAKAEGLPEVGQFYGKGDFNAETVAQVKPQLIIDIGEPKKTMKDDMDGVQEKTGIPTIFVELKMENAAQAYRTLGKILSVEERAEKLATYCEKVYGEITDGVAKIPEEKRARYAFLVGEDGLNAIAKGSFQGEMLEKLGSNVVEVENPTAKGSGNEISAEELIGWDPEYIIFGPKSAYDTAAEDPFFSTLQAVQNNHYYEVPASPYNWVGMPPSVNRFLGMQWLAKVFYPDTFTYDLKERVQEYYKLFYDYELTDAQYQTLVEKAVK